MENYKMKKRTTMNYNNSSKTMKIFLNFVMLFLLNSIFCWQGAASTNPEGKEDCLCEWTDWMKNEIVAEQLDLTYSTLRGKGYSFCETPEDIQCYNEAYNDNSLGFGVTCTKNNGLYCPFLCDLYKIKVLCCYCSPDPIGPKFQMQNQNGLSGCLTADSSLTSFGVSVAECTDADSQNWQWVSKSMIKNFFNKRCLAISDSSEVITQNCESSNSNQEWKYLRRDHVLQFGKTKDNLNYRKDNKKLRLHSSRGVDSQWLALISEFDKTTGMQNLQNTLCEPTLTPPENGEMDCTLGAYVSSVCQFSCDYGYSLPDGADQQSQCTEDGEFTNNPPVCEKIQCFPGHSTIEHGNVTCTNANNLDSTCTFECEKGYKIANGNKQLFCLESKSWDASPPICERIKCEPNLIKEGLENGNATCSNENLFSSVCVYSCSTGFELIGPAGHECLLSGKWNDTKPVCQKIQCPSIYPPLNGVLSCDKETYYGSICRFNCNVGYTMDGSGSTTCTNDKTWSAKVPQCQRKRCNPHDIPDHGKMSCDDGEFYGSKCTFSCMEGYKLEGESLLECTGEGWDKGVPTCTKITCSRLNSPTNGAVMCSNQENYESECKFSCSTGYEIPSGINTLTCGENGWNNEIPTCTIKKCPAISTSRNGVLECSDNFSYSSVCYLECNEGYEINKKPPFVKCQGTASWSDELPECEKIQCRKLSSLRSGTTICTDGHNFNSTCTFACLNGYNLFGSDKTTCRDNGWDSEMPNCAKRTCSPPLGRPYNGQINCDTSGAPQCSFSCNKGYTLVGEDKSVCQADETWSNTEVPMCQRIECTNAIKKPTNGQVECTDGQMYGSKCTFSCNKGYSIVGEITSECNDKRTWTNPPPVCNRIFCPAKEDIENGLSQCSDGNFYQSACTAQCNTGYKLIGTADSKCQLNSTWTAVNPFCERIMCTPLFTNPSNGKVACSDVNNYGSSCSFICDEGFHLEGAQVAICRAKGWSVSKPPQCKKILCPEEFSTDNVYSFEGCDRSNEYLSKCNYKCKEGFKLIGDSSRRCTEAGTWSAPKPQCEKIQCPKLTIEDDQLGYFNCTMGYEYDSSCFGSCPTGYSFTSGIFDKFVENLFFDDENLYEGSGFDHSNNSFDKVSFSCHSNGLWNGLWSNVTGNCIKIVCPKLPTLDNGEIVCVNENAYNAECFIICNDGYERKGSSMLKCQLSGKWNPEKIPTCERDPTFIVASTTKSTTLSTTTERTTTTNKGTTTTPTTTPATTTTEKTTTIATTKPKLQAPARNLTVQPPSGNTGFTKSSSQVTNPKIITNSLDMSVTKQTGSNEEQSGITGSNLPRKEQDFPIIVVIIVAVVIVLVMLSVAIYFIWKRQSKKKPSFTPSSLMDNRYENTEFGPLIPNGNGSTHVRAKYPSIPLDRLEMEYNKRRGDDDKLFREEFHSFQEGIGSKDAGGKAHNKEKNRYTNILPYDHSRVILPKNGEDASDYINASFIDGYKQKGKFIAAQGPKVNTINDFWRMVWEQNVSTIVMATNLDERNEEKCARYWPLSGQEIYGDLAVTLAGENHLVDFSIRKFTLQRGSGQSTLSMARNLNHYHFTSWPDFGVPKTPSGMLKFIRKIKHDTPPGFGSIVVHCSAGVGRTGTFIAIDAMMDMIARESKIDVHSFVTNMRQQRPEMVQTEQQYVFIYQAMLEHHLYGDTEVEVNEVASHIDELMQRLPGNVTGMEHEFKKLTSIRIQKENMRAGNNPANMRKNRVLLILPYDSNRVILPMKRGQENTDYINASYIDGYRQKDAYIATQGPLPHTIEDFWRMVWDVQAASVVMLTELVERGQAKCAQYWPKSGMEAYGDLRVELSEEINKEDYTERELVLSSVVEGPGVGRQQVVKQFHYHGWPEVGAPSAGYSMITLINDVQRQQQSSGNHPIVIHCSAGAGRTGAFCALTTALEQVKAEGVLDIFQIVKCLRIQRPHMVQNLEQYEFCYRAVQEYIDSMSEYYNFK